MRKGNRKIRYFQFFFLRRVQIIRDVPVATFIQEYLNSVSARKLVKELQVKPGLQLIWGKLRHVRQSFFSSLLPFFLEGK